MYRNYCFTINNPKYDDYMFIQVLKSHKSFRYCIYSIEKSTTLHIQGYVEFTSPMRLTTLKKLNMRAHYEPRKGTQLQAIEYCKKSDTHIDGPFEFGTPSKQGNRNDIVNFKDDIKEGQSNQDLIDNYPSLVSRCPKFINFVRSEFTYKSRAESILNNGRDVVVLWGPSGSGKTSFVYKLFDIDEIYSVIHGDGCVDTLWFDGYQGQKCLLIDDFYSWIKFDFLLRLLDRYPIYVQSKGGSILFCSEYIYITSNQNPNDWYRNIDKSSLFRRISLISHIEESPYHNIQLVKSFLDINVLLEKAISKEC